MNKTDLLKPGGSRAHQLTELSREINERQETIELARGKVLDAGSTLVCEAIFQGGALLKVKAILKHGDFTPWIKAHCPMISHDTANRYMRLAINTGNGKNLEGATSIREALMLCSQEENGGSKSADAPRSWPAYLEALSRLGKFAGLVERNPLAQWPPEGRDKLKQDLEPIAAALWPEKFA